MKSALLFATLAFASLFGCQTKPPAPPAFRACEKLASAGVAVQCRAAQANGLASAAREVVAFNIPGLRGGGGQVMHFEKAADLAATEEQLETIREFVGPHRYVSEQARVLVQLNPETPAELGAKAKSVVLAL